MPVKVTLAVTAGPLSGRSFVFDHHDTFIFGRAPECHARLAQEDTTASRHHFLLEVNPPHARLRDLGSLNGTHVNEVKHGGRGCEETPDEGALHDWPEIDLKHGDRIRVGATVFEVAIEAPRRCSRCQRPLIESGDPSDNESDGKDLCRYCRGDAEAAGAVSDASQQSGDGNSALGGHDFDALAAPVSSDEAGRRIPRTCAGYDVERLLGKGGMGMVYLARRRGDGLPTALKVTLSQAAIDEYTRELFLREIEITRSLKHPNIVELYEHGSSGNVFYFAMEYCPGGNLEDLLRRRRAPLKPREAFDIAMGVLDGLAFAHERGFVHRDLKPENILLASADERVAKISDFGLAKSFQQSGLSGMTATGTYGGTIHFMPREQLLHFRDLKPISDVWSFGATLYYMLTRRYTRRFLPNKDPLQVILKESVVPIRVRDPQLPESLVKVIDRAISDTLKERYATAGELRDALRRAMP